MDPGLGLTSSLFDGESGLRPKALASTAAKSGNLDGGLARLSGGESAS